MSKYTIDLKITGGAIDDLDAARKAAEGANTSLKAMKQELRNVTSELLATEPGTQKFIELTQKAGQLKDQMKDVAESINANAGPAVESLGNNFSLLTGKLKNLDFQGASESIKAIGGNIANIKFSDFSEGIKSAGGALASVGKALLTNPLFLLAGTIALAVTYFDDLVKVIPGLNAALTGVTDEMQESLNIAQEETKLAQERLNFTKQNENVLKLQGLTEKEIANLKKFQTDQAIKKAEVELNAQRTVLIAQIETEKRNKKILQGLIDIIARPIALLLQGIDAAGKAFGQDFGLKEGFNNITSGLVFDPAEVEAEGAETIKALEGTIQTLKNESAGYELFLRNASKETAKQRVDNEKKAAEEILAIRQKAAVDLGGIQAAELKIVAQSQFERSMLERQAAEAKQALDKQTFDKNVQMAGDAAGALLSLNDAILSGNEKAARKSFAIGKALSLAQAIQNSYAAINAVLKDPTLVGPSRFIAAGIAGAQGLANVIRIARTQFNPGGGGSSSGGGSAPRPSLSGGSSGGGTAPSTGFGAFDQTLINNRPAQVTPAYVLASDVKSQTEARQKVEDRARL
jgi:hypothetical protein